MAKAHPAKKARFLAGCMGAAGFAVASIAILQDSLVAHEISPSLLQAPQTAPQPVGVDSEAFALQGSAAPAGPQVNESASPDTPPAEAPQTTQPEQPTPTKAEPAPKPAAKSKSDAKSDAS